VTGLLPELPDMVISGINHGANMGDDTVYSGTVAAATEGFMLGIPSIAISLVTAGQDRFDTAARVAVDLVGRFAARPFSQPVLLNVNVPDVPRDAIAGIEVTRLGRRHKAQDTVKIVNPRNQTMYWVGAAGAAQDAGPGTDFHAASRNCVSITPLQLDLTHYPQMAAVGDWLGK
jgi:5'-nucleotidase